MSQVANGIKLARRIQSGMDDPGGPSIIRASLKGEEGDRREQKRLQEKKDSASTAGFENEMNHEPRDTGDL